MGYGNDRFGRPQAVIAIKDKGEKMPRGYVEIKSKLYQVTVSDSKKEGVAAWVTLTEMDKKNQGGFGGSNNNNRQRKGGL